MKLIIENTSNLENFLSKINEKFNLTNELEETIKDFIEKSNCKKIEFAKFKAPVMGLALHDGVLINENALQSTLEFLIFLIFHEIAHQYQFKKYGEEKMYDCYVGEITEDEAADFMKKTEIVADEFALRKVRQLQKMGLIDSSYTPPQVYKNIPYSTIKSMVRQFREMMKSQNIKSPEKISEFFYNMVKENI
jgi:hypothetical protein